MTKEQATAPAAEGRKSLDAEVEKRKASKKRKDKDESEAERKAREGASASKKRKDRDESESEAEGEKEATDGKAKDGERRDSKRLPESLTSQKHHLMLREKMLMVQISSSLTEWSTKIVSPPEVEKSHSYSFLAACRGLICLSYKVNDKEDMYVLWNPFTNEHKIIPPSTLPLPSCDSVHDITTCTRSVFRVLYGLGFDAESNDYKLVTSTIVMYFDDEEDMLSNEMEITVYSLNSNTWKKIPSESSNVSQVGVDSVSLDGMCYWGAFRSNCVVSFNFSSEEFSSFPLPNTPLGFDTSSCLIEFNGSLAFVVSSWYGAAKHFRFWIMNVVDGVYVWVRKYKFDVCGVGAWNPLGSCRNGSSLLLQGTKGTMFEYDYYTQYMKRIEECSDHMLCMRMHSFVESSVKLNNNEAPHKGKGKRKRKWHLTRHKGERKNEGDDEGL